jgi:hypothetical protein
MSMWTGIRAGAARVFFRQFFRLLIFSASAAQWAVVAWVASVGFGWTWPVVAHAVGIAGSIVQSRLTTGPSRRRGWAFRTLQRDGVRRALLFAVPGRERSRIPFLAGACSACSARRRSPPAAGDAGGLDWTTPFRWVTSFGMTVIALTMGYGYAFGQRALRVTRIPVGCAGLARPLRIAQISRHPHRPDISRCASLHTFVARVNATEPDLICITGRHRRFAACRLRHVLSAVLAQLRARVGVCAILGNHDHHAGAERRRGGVAAPLRPFTSCATVPSRWTSTVRRCT